MNAFLFHFVDDWGGGLFFSSRVIRIAIGFFGAASGFVAGKGICDALLKIYSGKTVSVAIVLIIVAFWCAIIYRGNIATLDTVEFAVESIASLFASALFWTEDPLATPKSKISN